LLAAALVTLAAGVAAAPAPAAKSTSQRLKALEAQAAALTRATNSLNAQHKALATAQTSLANSYASLNVRYTSFVSCLRRTPLFSYPGYAWDSDGNGSIDTTTRGLDWYVTSGGVVPTGVLTPANFVNSMHALSLANTDGCLAFAAFRNPMVLGSAAQGSAAKGPSR
jgi:hypothetical protein